MTTRYDIYRNGTEIAASLQPECGGSDTFPGVGWTHIATVKARSQEDAVKRWERAGKPEAKPLAAL